MKIYSIIRQHQYEKLECLKLTGKILDVGGSKKSGYHELLDKDKVITVVNINPAYGCDLIFDIQDKFPIEDGAYDNVVCLNVLEHIFKFDNVFKESARVIKKGGKFVVSVPFMHQIHGSPDDFYRFTKSALINLGKENGFSCLLIEELGYGLFSLFFSIVGGVLPGSFLKNICKNIAINLDKVASLISGRFRKLAKNIPLGYFVVFEKL